MSEARNVTPETRIVAEGLQGGSTTVEAGARKGRVEPEVMARMMGTLLDAGAFAWNPDGSDSIVPSSACVPAAEPRTVPAPTKPRRAAAPKGPTPDYTDEPWFKLQQRIFSSSIWEEDPATRIVWITLLHLAQEQLAATTQV